MRSPDKIAVTNLQRSRNVGVQHAAEYVVRFGVHVLACNGRAVSATGWFGHVEEVTCVPCTKALATGKAEWSGQR